MFGRMGKAALAGAAVKEARKPENQRRLKSLFHSLTGKGGDSSTQPQGRRAKR